MSDLDNLSLEEQRAMIARSSSGEQPIFTGEEASFPQVDLNRHGIHTGQCFEVDPEQLIDVAKHLAKDGESTKKTIERAYSLICEAHVTSRNIRHWNAKVRRGHVSDRIHKIVEEHIITTKTNKGKVPRLAVTKALLELRGMSSNDTQTGKLFNTWVRESLRKEDYDCAIPWNPVREGFDEALNKTLLDKGWIQWLRIGNAGYLILPECTTKPITKPKKKVNKDDHVTRPWWGTKKVWWPNPSKEHIRKFKNEYLIDNFKHFKNAHTAQRALYKFDRWLDIMDAHKRQSTKLRKSKPKRDSDSGEFK